MLSDPLKRCRRDWLPRHGLGELVRFVHESIEQSARKLVSLPGEFRMPLHTDYETIATWILDSLNEAIGRPGRGHQFPSQCFDSLMMVTIDRRAIRSCQLSHDTVLQ